MATRETLTISLPPEMRAWIDTLVKAGGYASVSEYIRETVRNDQAKRLRERITAELLETIAANDVGPTTSDDFEQIKRILREREAADQQNQRRRRAG
jgi:antitoxin ParD1/3/4